jgi:predicted 3-demethylubiquinone-9 3-methyltransferase (glyoxalase superfamily)
MSIVPNRIRPCLWFDGQGEDAAKFYCGIFPNSKITGVSRYVEESKETHGQKIGSVMTVAFELDGQPFLALNGGPHFKFNETVSLMVSCATQNELDRYWNALSAVADAEICGWCKDKFGLSWQIVPAALDDMLTKGSDAQRNRVMKVVMSSKKLNIAKMQEAYNG